MTAAAQSNLGPFLVPADAKPVINPWFIAITVTLATFMELLDTSIANVALPHIAGGLSTDQDQSTWVLTSYLVSNAVVLPLSAWLSTVFGRKRFYMTCVGLFTISSALCGFAPTLPWLIFFRVLQGIGGGGLAPSEQAILVDTFPPAKRAAAFALYSIAIVAAPAIGPTLGGWITDNWSWRWVFFINIPIGALSLVLTYFIVPQNAGEVKQFRKAGSDTKSKMKIDFVGILLVAVGFGCLEVVLDKGQEDDWFGSNFIVLFFTIAMIALICAFFWELWVDEPVVDLRLMKDRNFAIACSLYIVFGFALFGSTVLLPQMMQSLFAYTATNAGMVLSPGAMVVMCMAPLSARLLKFVQPKWMVLTGMILLAISLQVMTGFDLDLDYRTVAHARMFQGLGIGLLFVPVSQIAYSYLPKDKNNQASSLTNLFRNQGGSFGIAFVTTMLARRSQYHQSILGAHISSFNSVTTDRLASMQTALTNAGLGSVAAATRAQATLYATVQKQASMMSFLDCFWLLSLVCVAGALVCLLVKPTNNAKVVEGGH